ncbi:hypothetical protein ACLOJK_011950 [Asimina triloba]
MVAMSHCKHFEYRESGAKELPSSCQSVYLSRIGGDLFVSEALVALVLGRRWNLLASSPACCSTRRADPVAFKYEKPPALLLSPSLLIKMLLHRLQHSGNRHHLPFVRLHRACPDPAIHQELIPKPTFPDPWIVKLVSALFLHSPHSPARSDFFNHVLSPSVAGAVVKRLSGWSPKVALDFFEYTKSDFGLSHVVETYRCLIKVLCRTGLLGAAGVVLEHMTIDGHIADGSAIGFLVSAHAQAGNFDSAMRLLVKALECKCRVNSVVYNNLLNLMVKKERIEGAVQFFRAGYFVPDTCTFNIVIKGLCRLGKVDQAFVFFNEMKSSDCCPDTITYNTLVDGLCWGENVGRARELLNEMLSNGVCTPDVVTFTSIIAGYCRAGQTEEASSVFNEMVSKFGIRPTLVTYNVMIDGYGKAGDIASALLLFEKMARNGCRPDVVTLTSLIDGYCRNGQLDDAVKLWNEMKERKLLPNVYTYAAVINGLCKENRLSEARDLLIKLKGRRDIVPRPFMYNPVIDGFCKSGNVDEANVIVKEMEEKGCLPDKLTFTILIIGHCMKGRMHEAIGLFDRMLTIGCPVDDITVSSLVSMLHKAGMPNEADQIVKKLSASDADLSLVRPREVNSLNKNADILVVV